MPVGFLDRCQRTEGAAPAASAFEKHTAQKGQRQAPETQRQKGRGFIIEEDMAEADNEEKRQDRYKIGQVFDFDRQRSFLRESKRPG